MGPGMGVQETCSDCGTSGLPAPGRDVAALEIIGLRKIFDRPAVDNLDLSVKPGEFYMLLGPNGAGKTTTLRMVAGLLKPDAGEISVFGVDALADPVLAKGLVGWLSDEHTSELQSRRELVCRLLLEK